MLWVSARLVVHREPPGQHEGTSGAVGEADSRVRAGHQRAGARHDRQGHAAQPRPLV